MLEATHLILLCALVEHTGINSRSQEIVSGSDGMDIAGKVEVELLHGHYLGVPTTCSTTLDTEGWALERQKREEVNFPS